MVINRTIIIATLLFLAGCSEKYEQNADPQYINEVEQWHTKRIENLKKENGWLNLAGLYWLKQGENKFGSANDNDIVFPETAPKHIGKITLIDSTVTIDIFSGSEVLCDSVLVTRQNMQHDLSGNPTIFSLGALRWFLIKRGEKYGIRLRDLESQLLKEFQGIERFPVNIDWRIEAEFVAYNPPKKILVPNVLGSSDEEIVPGKLLFKYKNKEYVLDPLDSGEKLFIIFADETNGETTYGAGRFLYADKPDSAGKVILDFNKSYNPPCVFTKFATCPLPPEQNRLALEITAGEKSFGQEH
ncbi:MAG: DUF1684 domain-containing protein [Ignavibacteriaceae bacterium]|nr:DUF1684 domain-containing protein [Ignavibacteriaceae bacterium]